MMKLRRENPALFRGKDKRAELLESVAAQEPTDETEVGGLKALIG